MNIAGYDLVKLCTYAQSSLCYSFSASKTHNAVYGKNIFCYSLAECQRGTPLTFRLATKMAIKNIILHNFVSLDPRQNASLIRTHTTAAYVRTMRDRTSILHYRKARLWRKWLHNCWVACVVVVVVVVLRTKLRLRYHWPLLQICHPHTHPL